MSGKIHVMYRGFKTWFILNRKLKKFDLLKKKRLSFNLSLSLSLLYFNLSNVCLNFKQITTQFIFFLSFHNVIIVQWDLFEFPVTTNASHHPQPREYSFDCLLIPPQTSLTILTCPSGRLEKYPQHLFALHVLAPDISNPQQTLKRKSLTSPEHSANGEPQNAHTVQDIDQLHPITYAGL